jgi:hypothetical protein
VTTVSSGPTEDVGVVCASPTAPRANSPGTGGFAWASRALTALDAPPRAPSSWATNERAVTPLPRSAARSLLKSTHVLVRLARHPRHQDCRTRRPRTNRNPNTSSAPPPAPQRGQGRSRSPASPAMNSAPRNVRESRTARPAARGVRFRRMFTRVRPPSPCSSTTSIPPSRSNCWTTRIGSRRVLMNLQVSGTSDRTRPSGRRRPRNTRPSTVARRG